MRQSPQWPVDAGIGSDDILQSAAPHHALQYHPVRRCVNRSAALSENGVPADIFFKTLPQGVAGRQCLCGGVQGIDVIFRKCCMAGNTMEYCTLGNAAAAAVRQVD